MNQTEDKEQRPDRSYRKADNIRWPRLPYNTLDEPHFVFILTPPYTGSTAMAKYLATSPNIGLLRENGEGQKLVPGIHRNWNANTNLDGESIRSAWLNKYQEISGERQLNIIVEKSPPNMVRIDLLRSLFRRTTCLVNNRDPVAFCSSTFYRNTVNAEQLSEPERLQQLKKFALYWVDHSKTLKEHISASGFVTCSYEQFCESPQSLKNTFEKATGEIIQPEKNPILNIKDYQPAVIKNKNQQQVSRLSEVEIESVVQTLRPYSTLTSFFGYAPEDWLQTAY